MNSEFLGVFEARTSVALSADRLYRIYWTATKAYFVRVGGQRLFLHGRPRWINNLLALAQRYDTRWAEYLEMQVYRWGEGREIVNGESLNDLPPSALLAGHKHNFVVNLDTLSRLSLAMPHTYLLRGEHFGVLSFQDANGTPWQFRLEGDIHFVTAVGLLPRLFKELQQDEFIRRARRSPNLQFLLGCGYEAGQNMPLDIDAAVAMYRLAADQGHAPGQCRMGFLTQLGISLPQDDRMALYWCRKATAQNYGPALTLMGDFCENGVGMAPSLPAAIGWYQRAAALHDGYAMFLLAEKYEQGQGVLRDYREAKSWYIRSAEQGYSQAQLALAKLLSQGLGISKDYYAAAFWFHRAAMQNNTEAQFRIGQLYELGYGVSRNEAMAVRWYLLAAQQDNPHAKEALCRLQEKGVTVVVSPFLK